MPIIVKYTWDAEEMIAAHRAYDKKQMRPALRYAMYGIFTPVAIGSILLGFSQHSWIGCAVSVAILYWLYLNTPLNRWRLRRHFANHPEKAQNVVWHIDDDKILTETPVSRVEFTWAAIQEIVRSEQGFLLFPQPSIYYWLPHDGFQRNEDYSAFAALAHSKVTKYREVE